MSIIDAHVHFSNIESFRACARHNSGVDYSFDGYLREAEACGISRCICMGLAETVSGGFPDSIAQTPMLADLAADLPPNMLLCPGINPHALSAKNLGQLEDIIVSSKRVVGVKLYAGYYHIDVNDPVYSPVYALAEKHDITVVIHTGDTYSDRALVALAHPLHLDRLAVNHRDMRIVACHLGVPWLYDACEVTAKNRNVFLDTSGLLVGGDAYIARMAAKPLHRDRYRQALEFMDQYDKLIFGTDWPLAPMSAYIDFCKTLIPPEFHSHVFENNVKRAFHLE